MSQDTQIVQQSPMPVGSEWWGAKEWADAVLFCNYKSRQCLSAVSGGVPAMAMHNTTYDISLSPMPVGSEWWGAPKRQ